MCLFPVLILADQFANCYLVACVLCMIDLPYNFINNDLFFTQYNITEYGANFSGLQAPVHNPGIPRLLQRHRGNLLEVQGE